MTTIKKASLNPDAISTQLTGAGITVSPDVVAHWSMEQREVVLSWLDEKPESDRGKSAWSANAPECVRPYLV